MLNLFFKKKSGFTLLELLVVIAIIGLFAAITVVSLSSSRKRSRDAKRIADLSAIQQALELYYNSKNRYPVNLEELISAELLPNKPRDPNDKDYNYCTNGLQSKYHLGAVLEIQDNNAFKNDSDIQYGEDGCLQSFDGADRGGMYDLAP